MSLRAALYKRVSSQAQVKEGYSLAFQEEIMRDYCTGQGLCVVRVYEDGGRTGSNTERAGLQALVRDAKQRAFDVVLIFRVDRFSRDPLDLLYLVQELNRRNITLKSVTEAVDASDPAGELMLTILGAIGKFVRANILQNAILGKRKRAEAGRYTGGALPFGYAATVEGQLVPNDEPWGGGHTAGEVVSRLFQHYVHVSEAEGRGLRAVSRWLNEQGIPSPTRARNGWNPTGIRQILRNPVYTGDYVWGKTSQPMHGTQTPRSPAEWVVAPGAHAALIDRALWDRAQSILDGNRTVSRARIQGTPDLLNGFVRCGLCGSLLTLRRPGSKNRYNYYTCGSRYNDARIRHGTVCAFPFIRADDLREAVWSEAAALATDPRAVARALGPDDGEAEREALDSRIAEARADIARCNRDEGKILDLALSDTFRPEVVAAKLEAIRNRVREAQNRLVRLEQEKRDRERARPSWIRDAEQVRAYFATLLVQGDLSLQTRRQILGAVVGAEGVSVFPDGRCEIRIRLPVEPPKTASGDDVSLAVASRHSSPP